MIKDAHFWVEGALQQPAGRRLVRPRRGPQGIGHRPRRPRRPVAEHDHAVHLPGLLREDRRQARPGTDAEVLQVPRGPAGERVPRRLLAGRCGPATSSTASCGSTTAPARSGCSISRTRPTASRALGYGTHQPAQRQHRPGVPRAGDVLAALRQAGTPVGDGESLAGRARQVGPRARRHVRRPTRTPASATPARGR